MDVTCQETPSFQGISQSQFDCARLRATLSRAACAKNFLAQAAFACQNCTLGQQHAQALRPDVKPVQDAGRLDRCTARACVRCGRPALRLVRGHTLCVSCFNREREVIHGRNAKGARPQKWRELLHPAHAEIRRAARAPTVIDLGWCTGRSEAERVVARRWPGATIIAFWQDAPIAKSESACHAGADQLRYQFGMQQPHGQQQAHVER